MTKDELFKLLDEFVQSQDDRFYERWYCTPRQLCEDVVDDLKTYLEDKNVY